MEFFGEADDDHEEQQDHQGRGAHGEAHHLELSHHRLAARTFVPNVVLDIASETKTDKGDHGERVKRKEKVSKTRNVKKFQMDLNLPFAPSRVLWVGLFKYFDISNYIYYVIREIVLLLIYTHGISMNKINRGQISSQVLEFK